MIRSKSCPARSHMMVLVAAAVAAPWGCHAPPPGRPAVATSGARGPWAGSFDREPVVRIRIGAGLGRARIASRAPVAIGPDHEPSRLGSTGGQHPLRARPRAFTPPVSISRAGGSFVIADGNGRTVHWALPTLRAESTDGLPLTVDGRAYAGSLRVVPRSAVRAGAFDLVNDVPVEQYLPGVLTRELYGRWHPSTFAAQAIAARSYAIAQRAKHPGRHFDLESTTASQAYGGYTTDSKALGAARRTRGLVLVSQGRVVPAYYSSCCGGIGQDSVAAFPNGPDLPPLRGGVHTWCSHSPHFRWGPITRDSARLARRIAAWGRANRHPVSALSGIRRIDLTARSRTGRPAVFTIVDGRGRAFALRAESLRFAANHEAASLRSLAPNQILKSSHVEIGPVGRTVRFADGRGYGHGVGLCQWGTQRLAEHGYDPDAILALYYPGARVQSVY